MEVEYLYHSDDIRAKIRNMFSQHNARRRRVIIAAYVGKDAATFLDYARGIEIYCWPLAGATNPAGVTELKAQGAQIHFAQGLHSKVYWVDGVGGLITSANLSASALDDREVRHEAGVFISTMGEDVIDKLISESNAHEMTELAFTRLQQEHEAFWLRNRARQPRQATSRTAAAGATYAEWYRLQLPKWKLNSPTNGQGVGLEATAEEEASRRTRQRDIEVYDHINGYKGEYRASDWVLYFELGRSGRLSGFEWIRLDYYIAVKNKEWPGLHQGVQIFPLPVEVEPPFKLDEAFRRAFTKAFRVGVDDEHVRPSHRLLRNTFEGYGSVLVDKRNL